MELIFDNKDQRFPVSKPRLIHFYFSFSSCDHSRSLDTSLSLPLPMYMLQTGKEETVIRRSISLKKDEYFLDRKASTRTEVLGLLEAAGFSRSNPYYIVPQGRITSLTQSTDVERLNLLKEVAGTHVYDTRRKESLKIMQETGESLQGSFLLTNWTLLEN